MSIQTGHPTITQMEATPNYIQACRRTMRDHCKMMLAFYERRGNEAAAASYREWLAELETEATDDQAE